MSVDQNNILDFLPYQKPFLFVDRILELNEEGAVGEYKFKTDEYFYEGHFKDNPITPGVILIECMAQIGLVALGIYLLQNELENVPKIAFLSSNVDFLKMVLPGDVVRVESTKNYFRLGKLKCDVVMKNKSEEIVCKGSLSGIMMTK